MKGNYTTFRNFVNMYQKFSQNTPKTRFLSFWIFEETLINWEATLNQWFLLYFLTSSISIITQAD